MSAAAERAVDRASSMPAAATAALVGGKGAGLHRLLARGGPGAARVRRHAPPPSARPRRRSRQAGSRRRSRALPADAPLDVLERGGRRGARRPARRLGRGGRGVPARCGPPTPSLGGRGRRAVLGRRRGRRRRLLRGRARHLPGVRGADEVAAARLPVLGQPLHRPRGRLPRAGGAAGGDGGRRAADGRRPAPRACS